jgi:glucosamine kinase
VSRPISCIVGVDVGATHTRALIATVDGEILGRGRAAGANRRSSGRALSVAIGTALNAALEECDASAVAHGVVGLAGVPDGQDVLAEVRAVWSANGLSGALEVVPDVVIAYAAGTPHDGGLVLAAGTGAIAAVVAGGQVVRRANGHGWIAGDEGSAVWIGIEGVRGVLRALDGRGPATTLTETMPPLLLRQSTGGQSLPVEIVAAIHALPPAALGGLAPAVVEAALAGDELSEAIVAAAANHLVDALMAVAPPSPPSAVVIAGSVLTSPGPIGDVVERHVRQRWPATPIVEVTSSEAGAAALALRALSGTPVDEALHARLCRPRVRPGLPPAGSPSPGRHNESGTDDHSRPG